MGYGNEIGRKPEKISKQHASQINKMLAVIDLKRDLASVHLIDKKARFWPSSYKKVGQCRHQEKQDEDLSNLITPKMVAGYEQRESTGRVVSLISLLSGAHCPQINQAEYTLIRDSS